MLEWISGNQVLKETGQSDYSLMEELKIIVTKILIIVEIFTRDLKF